RAKRLRAPPSPDLVDCDHRLLLLSRQSAVTWCRLPLSMGLASCLAAFEASALSADSMRPTRGAPRPSANRRGIPTPAFARKRQRRGSVGRALAPRLPNLVGVAAVEVPPLRPAWMEAAVVVNGVRPG